ncbi:Kinesin-like protein [Psidium guajava]|nr:Kinesin-like protein [Psidium guajava]
MDSRAMRPCRPLSSSDHGHESSSSSHGRGILAASQPWPPSVKLAAARPWLANPKLELVRLERPWQLQARGLEHSSIASLADRADRIWSNYADHGHG